jgi:predicted RNA binding protein YcfA (HicA-like mRNA interferase family)
MGKLANISGKDAAKAFQKAGWHVRGQVGSHLVLTKPEVKANLTVPQHSELAVGTLRSLIRTAGLTVDEFLKLI